MFPIHGEKNELTCLAQAYTYKIILAYTFGDYQSALDYIAVAKSYLTAVSPIIFFPIYHFYAALTYLAVYTPEGEIEQADILAQAETHQNILYQWAQTAPMNHLHQWHLIEAEKQRLLNNKAAAIENYDSAIKLAKENQYLHEEALANKLAAKFYFDCNKEEIADIYLRECHYTYNLWGAKDKVKQLEQKYPRLLQYKPKNTAKKAGLPLRL